jgi:hypothetical protein
MRDGGTLVETTFCPASKAVDTRPQNPAMVRSTFAI